MASRAITPSRSAGNFTYVAGLVVLIAGGLLAWTSTLDYAPLTSVRKAWQQHYTKQDIVSELKPHLSAHAEIYTKGIDGYAELASRWTAAYMPHFDAVVKVATEQDISETVKFASRHGKAALAISGTHGGNTAMLEHSGVIGVSLRDMNGINVSQDGTTATIGGGAIAGDVWETLCDQGKETGFIAPMLGGGHGWLQGRYGLLADNLVSARLVLANGDVVTVSETEHPDLFWGLRGAGHNFGIVSSVQYKVYSRTPETDVWTVGQYIFTHDKLEALTDRANEMLVLQEQPDELAHFMFISNNADVDPENPSILLFLIYQSSSTPEQLSAPILALGPVRVNTITTDLPGMAATVQMSKKNHACQHGMSSLRFPVGLQNYSTAALRSVIDTFRALPPSLQSSVMLLEAYSMRRVHEIAEASTAFPERQNYLLLSPFLTYVPDPEIDKIALEHGKEIRRALVEGSGRPLNAYVNYANGDESQEAVYGYEPWRLEKLRRLKRRYDPHGTFNSYMPIQVR